MLHFLQDCWVGGWPGCREKGAVVLVSLASRDYLVVPRGWFTGVGEVAEYLVDLLKVMMAESKGSAGTLVL